MLLPLVSLCQPYIISTAGTGAGLGEYGYLERNAITYATLHRNDYNNIDFLSARFWVTDNNNANGNGSEYVYHTYNGPDGNWNCDDAVFFKRTANYAASNFGAEWAAGSDVYVSVFAKYCPVSSGPWGPSAPNGSTTGYNEKHFQVIDVDNTSHVSVTNLVTDGNGDCSNAKVVGSFEINPGNLTGVSLTRLKLWNVANSQETNDIPVDGLKIWYEKIVTGSEVFDGNETLPTNNIISGILGGDSQYNNFYESNNLSIPLDGRTRIYITLCNLANTYTPGRYILLYITNDGIELSPAQTLNGSTNFRVDLTNITNNVGLGAVLPYNDIKFSGAPYREGNNIKIAVNRYRADTKTMILQKSRDGYNWQNVSAYTINTGTPTSFEYYDREVKNVENYYRLQFISVDGNKNYSFIIQINNRFIKSLGNYRLINPVDGNVFLMNNSGYKGLLKLMVVDAGGRVISNTVIKVANGQRISIPLPYNAPRGLYFLSAGELSGDRYVFKFMK
jgi:hypothetical protein